MIQSRKKIRTSMVSMHKKAAIRNLARTSPDPRSCRSPAAQTVGLDVHHLPENMRVHGKQRTE